MAFVRTGENLGVSRRSCRDTNLVMDVSKGFGHDAVRRGLPTKGFTNDHEAVTHDHHLVDLLHLLQEEVGALQVHLLAVLPGDGTRREGLIVSVRKLIHEVV